MNYSFIISALNQLKKTYLISLNALILGKLSLSLTLGGYLVLGAIILGLNKHGLEFFSLFVLTECSLGLLPLLVLIGFISYLAKNTSLGLLLLYLTKILFTYINIVYVKIKWDYPPKPHLLIDTPLQSNIFSGNLLGNLKIKFKDPKFWMNWICTVLMVGFTRYLYINSGLDIGWLLECFSLSSLAFFTRQIFSVLFDTIRLPVGRSSIFYMDNPGNPSSSNPANSIDPGNQQVKVTNTLTKEELREISGKLSKNTKRIGEICRSIDSKIANLEEGYSKKKHDSLIKSIQALQDTQVDRNTLFGDVYARNGDASALQQTQYPPSVHNTIRRAQSILNKYNH